MIESLILAGVLIYCSLVILFNLLKLKNKQNQLKIAFFHPFCNDGGGGQKVLWCIIDALLNNKSSITPKIAIYSLVQNKQQILQKVKNRFALDLSSFKDRIQIIHVPGRNLLVPQKKLTMVFHIILPLIYAFKCLLKYQPDVFYDTTGFASTLFLSKILLPTTKTVAYVHYPFISLDMIQKVKQRRSDFNNDQRQFLYRLSISKSPIKTKLKLIYYQTIFWIYKLNGYFVDFAQTNSSWTHNHLTKIWTNLQAKNKLVKVYPPCSVQDLLKYKKITDSQEILMMSLAQFRPQKNHKCQINTVKRIVELIRNYLNNKEKQKLNISVKLYICGTTRGSQDQEILKGLKSQVASNKLQNHIEFQVNRPFVDILKFLEKSLIGIHTMEAQHFGISVVQMLAAGLIVVAHNSAGPKQDIIKDQQFLAINEQDYFSKIVRILKSSSSQKDNWIKQNRIKAQNFGQTAFKNSLLGCLQRQLTWKIKSN